MSKFKKIIELLNGQSALVRRLKAIKPESKIQQGHINNWIYRDNAVPAEWVIPCCQAVDFKITPHELRPDLYPNAEDGLPRTYDENHDTTLGRRSNDRRHRHVVIKTA